MPGSSEISVIAFVISLVLCLAFLLTGLPGVMTWLDGLNLPEFVVDTITSLNFLAHFEDMGRGLVELPDVIFFASVIVFFLFLNALILDARNAD